MVHLYLTFITTPLRRLFAMGIFAFSKIGHFAGRNHWCFRLVFVFVLYIIAEIERFMKFYIENYKWLCYFITIFAINLNIIKYLFSFCAFLFNLPAILFFCSPVLFLRVCSSFVDSAFVFRSAFFCDCRQRL